MSKYHAKKTMVNGIRFDSKKEAERYIKLKKMQEEGLIHDLNLQVPFELIPSQKDPETGKVIERACHYKADFTYQDKTGYVVEDTKGVKTPDYIIKRKLMLEKYGIRIKEV